MCRVIFVNIHEGHRSPGLSNLGLLVRLGVYVKCCVYVCGVIFMRDLGVLVYLTLDF